MKRVVVGVVALAALQGALWLAWRAGTPESAPFSAWPASGPAPAVAPRDGALHVWATWCAPCRDELPGLLAAARAEGVPLVAVSVDASPAPVTAFFDGRVPPEVVRDPGLAERVGVGELPATFRVEGGALVGRVQGAADWSSAEARAWLQGAADRAPR